MKKIAIFTENYPFTGNGGEVSFIDPEFEILNKTFDIVFFPANCSGVKVNDNAVVDESWSLHLNSYSNIKRLIISLISKKTYDEILKQFNRKKWFNLRLLTYVSDYYACKDFFKKNDKIKCYDGYYTYWCNAYTSAIVECTKKPVITRAHGYDVYSERHKYGHIPFQQETLAKLSAVICVSKDGERYLNDKFALSNISTFYLGVAEQKTLAKRSDDGVFRVVSCSSIIPLKRVWLIHQVLCELSFIDPQLKIEWTHIGGGKIRLIDTAPNLKVTMLGHCNHDMVIKFYQSNCVDLFIHASETEGVPVSIQEAMSFGIPVVSSDAGGCREVVSDDVGKLVSVDNFIDEAVSFISSIYNTDELKLLGDNASNKQKLYFNSKINHEKLNGLLYRIFN